MEQPPDFLLFTSLRYDPLLPSLPANTSSFLTSNPQESTHMEPSSPFYMAAFHRDRILQAAEHFKWSAAASKIRGPEGFSFFLEALHDAIDTNSPQPLRVRVLLDRSGEITVEFNPVPQVSQWNLFPRRLPPPRGQTKNLKVSPLTGGALTLGSSDSIYGDPETSPEWEIIPDPASTEPSAFTSHKTTSRDMYNAARERAGIRDGMERKEVLICGSGASEGEVMEGSLTSCYFWREGQWTTPRVEAGGQDGTTRRWALEKGLCVEGTVRMESLREGEECWISNGVRGFSLGRVARLNK